MPRAEKILMPYGPLEPEYAGCAILLADPPPTSFIAHNSPAAQRVIAPIFGGKVDVRQCLMLHT